MPSKSILLIKLTFTLVIIEVTKSLDLCSNTDMNERKSLLLITFGSGREKYSNKKPSHFNFTTDYQQKVLWPISQGEFGFVNRIPDQFGNGHTGKCDYTLNNGHGYMYLVNIGSKKKKIVNATVNNLSIGMRYEYSAYLANIIKQGTWFAEKPKILFEVRNPASPNKLFGQFTTNSIPQHKKLTWKKYGVSFVAATNSVILLMKSCVTGDFGNDIAIDDIELRACSNNTIQHHDADTTSRATPVEDTCEAPKSALYFVPDECSDSTNIGVRCNTSSHFCNLLDPCQNGGTCRNITDGYNCFCRLGFTGSRCESNHQLCRSDTCSNHGKCNPISNTTYNCTCDEGWEGINCASMIHLCHKNICLNQGVCFPSLLNFTCKCVSEHYSGRYCEIIGMRLMIYKFISKSCAYIAIIAMASVAMFVVIMDILKYCFGIDPVEEERERMRREKQARKRKPPVIQRFTYVNKSPSEA